ncbi:MAG: Mov34/MPN/PAD-1 family protein [Candidatus Kuenenbacteria bacterium]
MLQTGFDLSKITESFAYILDSEGWKIYKRNGVSTAIIAVDSVSGLPHLETKIDFTAAKRIPLDLVRKVTAWFRSVYLKFKSEAVGYLYYNPADGNWDFIPPTQTTSGASADYEKAPKKDGWQVAGTIHSHASMSAFHSGTDDNDEKFFDGVHITIGRLDSVPEYSCSVVVHGQRSIVDPSILVDGMAPANDIPAEWVSAVKEPKPSLAVLFQPRVEKIYTAYYNGQISEMQYKRDLAAIEKEAEAHRKVEEERIRKEQQNFTPRSPLLSEDYNFDSYPGAAGSRQSFTPKKNKGGRKW